MSGRNFSLKEMETFYSLLITPVSIFLVRKELLSERDGNSTYTVVLSTVYLLSQEGTSL